MPMDLEKVVVTVLIRVQNALGFALYFLVKQLAKIYSFPMTLEENFTIWFNLFLIFR